MSTKRCHRKRTNFQIIASSGDCCVLVTTKPVQTVLIVSLIDDLSKVKKNPPLEDDHIHIPMTNVINCLRHVRSITCTSAELDYVVLFLVYTLLNILVCADLSGNVDSFLFWGLMLCLAAFIAF